MRNSALALVANALTGNRHWKPFWTEQRLGGTYDVVIIGGGGHGLATAYYLAHQHRAGRIAVIEKGWLGGGNSGRNTQATRANYFHAESAAFFARSLRLYETLHRELNINVMLSQRGLLTLAHSRHELHAQRGWCTAVRISGIDGEMVSPAEIALLEPRLNLSGRYPVVGGFLHRGGGVSRHDAVVWGYARAASQAGVHLVPRCEVLGFKRDKSRVTTVYTSQGNVSAGKVVIAAAAASADLLLPLGIKLPIRRMALQAMVTEPVKPVLETVLMSPVVHCYVSQSDRGEIVIGGGADGYTTAVQRGDPAVLEDTVRAFVELFPSLAGLKLMRHWAGIVDVTPDSSPLVGKTPFSNLYVSCGWGTGGYKAIPAGGETLAATVATDTVHPLIRRFTLDRFATGALVDEGMAAGVAH